MRLLRFSSLLVQRVGAMLSGQVLLARKLLPNGKPPVRNRHCTKSPRFGQQTSRIFQKLGGQELPAAPSYTPSVKVAAAV